MTRTLKKDRKVMKLSEETLWRKIKHERCYLHCQESKVSKLLIKTANLVLIHPGLVLCG